MPATSHAAGPPGFSITAGTPSGGTLTEGTTTTQTITVSALNGYTGTTNLVASVAPGTGFACSLTPTFVVPAPAPGGTPATLSCQANSAGTGTVNYGVTVVGSDQTTPNLRNMTDPIPYTVTTPLFGVSANPTSVNAAAGTTTGTSTITITYMNSFAGTVSLAAKGPVGFSCSFNPPSVTATGTSVMTCGGAVAGANGLTVNATAPSPTLGTITVFHQVGMVYNLKGIVCLTDPGTVTGSSACPASRALSGISSRVAGTQLRVAVALNDSDSINGFEVVLWADHTKLQPFDADLTGTLLTGTVTTLAKCIGGVLTQGSSCFPIDTPDTIQLSASSNQLTANPSTGLLFTAVYNIKANNTTPINIGFQTGCGNTVVPTSLPPICVSLINGGFGSLPEFGALNATYVFGNTQPIFGVHAKQTVFTFTQGTAGTQGSTVYQTEINGFSCGGLSCVDLSTLAASPGGLPSGLTLTVLPTSISDSTVLNATLTLQTKSFTPAGVYLIYIVGKPDTTNTPSTGTTYLGSVLTLTVVVVAATDFAMTADPTSVFTLSGNSAGSTITIAGGSSFSGTINLSVTAVPSAGLTCTLTPTSVTLPLSPPSPVTSQLGCTSTGGTITAFVATITGVSGSLSHTVTVSFGVIDFSINANPSPMIVTPGSTGTSTITLKGVNGFAGTVSLTASITATGATATFSPASVAVIPAANVTSILTVSLLATTSSNSTVTVTATGGGITHTLTFTVIPGTPNISIISVTASTGTSATIGDTVTISVKVQNTAAIAGTFQLSVSYGQVTVGAPINVTVPAQTTRVYNFTWNTAGYAAGPGTLKVVISQIPQGNISSGQAGTFSPTTFTLNAAPTSPLGDILIYIIAAVLAVIVIAAALLLLRRRGARKTSTPP